VIQADAEALIHAPIEAVFGVLADATNELMWLPGAQAVEKVTGGPVGLGTRFRGTYARAGAVSLEIVEFRRPTEVTFRARSRIVHFDDVIHLTDADGGTRLTAHLSAQPQGVMRLFGRVMARTMRAQFEQNWTHLAAYLEGVGAASPGTAASS
jgi:carbon monoxide dehydrogenase subunit G